MYGRNVRWPRCMLLLVSHGEYDIGVSTEGMGSHTREFGLASKLPALFIHYAYSSTVVVAPQVV